MSVMCKMNGKCSQTHGMCGHEKTMAIVIMLGIVAAVAHWGFNLL